MSQTEALTTDKRSKWRDRALVLSVAALIAALALGAEYGAQEIAYRVWGIDTRFSVAMSILGPVLLRPLIRVWQHWLALACALLALCTFSAALRYGRLDAAPPFLYYWLLTVGIWTAVCGTSIWLMRFLPEGQHQTPEAQGQ